MVTKMKRALCLFIALILSLSAISCGTPGLYVIDELIPPLIDISTQYPCLEKITVFSSDTQTELEFTEGTELDNIRMRFEGIKCIREKLPDAADHPSAYTVAFFTSDSEVKIYLVSESVCIINDYKYEAMTSGFDFMYFAGLFDK